MPCASSGIHVPLMIVKGDGTLALAETVSLCCPIETVMSGPAASLVGARWLSGRDSFIMSDMGGTTTDLGVVVWVGGCRSPKRVQRSAAGAPW